MTQHRIDLVHQAFNKLDKDGSGVVTTDDLKVNHSLFHYRNNTWQTMV